MPNGTILEISSLSQRHPKTAFARMYGFQAAVRLGFDPVRSASGVARRTVTVDYLAPRARESVVLTREIDWADSYSESECHAGANTGPERSITEEAALVVMALLVHDIAGLEIQRVLEQEEKVDYAAEVIGSGQTTFVEVSGILQGDLANARERVRKKTAQLLEVTPHGYVSVTTFSLLPDRELHSFLHCVGTHPTAKKPRKRKR